jgi:hypothetical protein
MLTEEWEFIGIYSGKSDGKVNNATVNYRSQNTGWQFSNDLSKEVSTDRVHVVVDFSQEYWSLVWENQNNVLNGIEGNSHGHEEEGTISVLDSLKGFITVLEKNDGEESSDDGNDELNVRGLWKSDGVQEVSSDQETELIHPTNLVLEDVFILDR